MNDTSLPRHMQRQTMLLTGRWDQLLADALNLAQPRETLARLGEVLSDLERAYRAYRSAYDVAHQTYRCQACQDTGAAESDDAAAFFVTACPCQRDHHG